MNMLSRIDAAIIHSSRCFPSSSCASCASTNFSSAFAMVPCLYVMALVRSFFSSLSTGASFPTSEPLLPSDGHFPFASPESLLSITLNLWFRTSFLGRNVSRYPLSVLISFRFSNGTPVSSGFSVLSSRSFLWKTFPKQWRTTKRSQLGILWMAGLEKWYLRTTHVPIRAIPTCGVYERNSTSLHVRLRTRVVFREGVLLVENDGKHSRRYL